MREILPADVLAIARDPADNFVCLGVSGEHAGRVYYWSHDTGDGPGVWGSIGSMCDSFPEFLARLRDLAGGSTQD